MVGLPIIYLPKKLITAILDTIDNGDFFDKMRDPGLRNLASRGEAVNLSMSPAHRSILISVRK